MRGVMMLQSSQYFRILPETALHYQTHVAQGITSVCPLTQAPYSPWSSQLVSSILHGDSIEPSEPSLKVVTARACEWKECESGGLERSIHLTATATLHPEPSAQEAGAGEEAGLAILGLQLPPCTPSHGLHLELVPLRTSAKGRNS